MKPDQKSRLLYSFGSILVCTAVVLAAVSCAQKPAVTNGSDAYAYPVRPGTAAWKALGSHVDMLKACQIPEDKLRAMSTAGLVETVLNYPLIVDAFAYNSPQQGLDAVSSQFNGIPALFNRTDAGTLLLAKYKAMDPAAFGPDWTELQKGEYDFKFMIIESLLAQDSVINTLNEAQCHDLVQECLAKNDSMRQTEIYRGMSQEYCIWVMSRVMEQVKYAPFTLKMEADTEMHSFVAQGAFANQDVINEIIIQAQGYLGIDNAKYTEPAVRPEGLPATVKFNPDTGEYYDSNIMAWDGTNQRYVAVEQPPVSITAEGLQSTEWEDWMKQHQYSNDPIDIALLKYNDAQQLYIKDHPKVGFRSDWGVDYNGEFAILTDLGVAGLPGLVEQVDANNPFRVKLVFAIEQICKTDIGYCDSFSPEQITAWKNSFNAESNNAKNIVAKAVETLKNNASVNHEEINNLFAQAGIFALPYFYDEIVSKANWQLSPYAYLVIPDATMKQFNLQAGNKDKDTIITALKSSLRYIEIIKKLAVN